MTKPKVGIIGCGKFEQLHSDIIEKLDNFKIAAYSYIIELKARECCDRYRANYYSSNYMRIIEDKRKRFKIYGWS